MFTDNFRLLRIISPLLIVLALIIYGEIKGPLLFPSFSEANKNPGQFINQEIFFGGKIEEINKDYFLVRIDKQPVKIIRSVEKNKLGYSITGKAIYLADGSLKLLDFHTSNLRIYKIILSTIPIAFIGYLFFKEYKFDKKTLTFIKR